MNIIYAYLEEHSDNQGEPCEYCQEEGYFNEANIYTFNGSEDEQYESCLRCVPDLVKNHHDSDQDVLVEVGKQ